MRSNVGGADSVEGCSSEPLVPPLAEVDSSLKTGVVVDMMANLRVVALTPDSM